MDVMELSPPPLPPAPVSSAPDLPVADLRAAYQKRGLDTTMELNFDTKPTADKDDADAKMAKPKKSKAEDTKGEEIEEEKFTPSDVEATLCCRIVVLCSGFFHVQLKM